MANEINHPLIKHKLTVLRDIGTSHKKFRELIHEVTTLLAYEAFKDIELEDIKVQTPLVETKGYEIKNNLVVVPILRAGVGMLDAILDLMPTARVGYVGLYRDPETKQPVEYYHKMAENKDNPYVVVIDPMLATGGSTVACLDSLKNKGFKKIKVICILAAPEGLEVVEKAHPDVEIVTASIDEYLDENKYIIPGLGDAGDRLFGTK